MRLNLLFGFLGSGKTTLAKRILTERAGAEKMAVIVNEFGDVGIDGAILKGNNVDMIELNSGCLCCTLKGSLLSAVEELRDKAGAQRIVVEATGVAQPHELIETFADPSAKGQFDIGPIVTVVNAPKFPILRDGLGEFFVEQLRNADVLILNKVDLAPAQNLESVKAEIRAINPNAEVLFAEQCDVDIARLLDGPDSAVVRAFHAEHGGHDHDDDHGHDHNHGHDHGDHRHAPAQSFVLDAGGGASRQAVESFFKGLPENVWRAKGFMDVDGRPTLIQYTMGQLDIAPSEPRAVRNMVFIGPDMDRSEIEGGFADLLAGGPRRAAANGGRR